MPGKSQQPQTPLPKSWSAHVKSGILHMIALAQYALTYSRSWAADKGQPGMRIELAVSYQHGRKRLPVVTIRRAA